MNTLSYGPPTSSKVSSVIVGPSQWSTLQHHIKDEMTAWIQAFTDLPERPQKIAVANEMIQRVEVARD
jgi:hypothetical protein